MPSVLLLSSDVPAWKPAIDGLTSAITVSEVAGIIGGAVAAGAAFVLLWFGARKAIAAFQAAFKSGKLKF